MIVKTNIGNNAFGLGLLTHIAAITVAMVPFGDTNTFITSVYILGSLLISIAIFSELLYHQKSVLKSWHFYAASALSLLAFIGPLFSCWILYTVSEEEKSKKSVGKFITSLLSLKIHPALLFFWLIAAMVSTSVFVRDNDPYFTHQISKTKE